jgi:hypothetical protein
MSLLALPAYEPLLALPEFEALKQRPSPRAAGSGAAAFLLGQETSNALDLQLGFN